MREVDDILSGKISVKKYDNVNELFEDLDA
jgi:hypothetical protein